MADDETSVHRRLPRLLVDLEDVFTVDRDDPRRFAYWKMRNAAACPARCATRNHRKRSMDHNLLELFFLVLNCIVGYMIGFRDGRRSVQPSGG